MGYYVASEFYDVYIWEYLNVLAPILTLYEKIGELNAEIDEVRKTVLTRSTT